MIQRDQDLLRRAKAAGIVLTVDGTRLIYRAPAGAMTPELKAILRELKESLVYEYHERAGIMEYDAGLPKAEAEAKAAGILEGKP